MPICRTQFRPPAAPQPARGPVGVLSVWLLNRPARGYRLLFSPWRGRDCRFQPTFLAYAIAALKRHGPRRGKWLMLWRLACCDSLGGTGYDPALPLSERKTLK
ncbi:membrane protein insertion efficiency factor YidD [Sedimentitalea sp.]|uniref:membrane protein insertion efficiency factor YidD n=1 Tax=Sedimentitalea sp. TaxID=2048915 RepID=UPI0032981053